MEPFCYGLSNSTGKRVIAAGEPVVKIVVLSGVFFDPTSNAGPIVIDAR
ncbi:MAG: hypothetical protein FD131_3244 [Rhodocyclaceae bacterium]|nr:MAG: hypothetical protein FD131_3244 [Rhodocyclaceae bacterium]